VACRKGAGPEAAATDLEAREIVGIGNAAVSKASPQDPQAVATAAAPTTYARAAAGYDEAFERKLVKAIIAAIAQASLVSGANCCVIRTGETASALLTVLAATLSLSPAAVRSPTALRRTIDELGKRLRPRVAAAQPDADAFRARCFTSDDIGGHA
jgi:uncharacterized protein YgbK (DUF1537 family)